MTQPRQAKQGSADGPRYYAWPPTAPHEFEVISVTSAVRGGYPKPFLEGWAAKMSAECAWDDFDVLKLFHEKGDQAAFLNHVKRARYRDRDAKAHRGTIVHSAIEAYIAGKPLTDDEINERLREKRVASGMWPGTRKMVEAVTNFFFEAEPEILLSEKTVYSRTHGYAGTLDILGIMGIGASRVPVVLDVKTSKRIYDETCMQLSAYARADFIGLDDGTEMPFPTAPPEYGVVVRPTASGEFETATFALTDEVYELFLSCLKTTTLYDVPATVRRPS